MSLQCPQASHSAPGVCLLIPSLLTPHPHPTAETLRSLGWPQVQGPQQPVFVFCLLTVVGRLLNDFYHTHFLLCMAKPLDWAGWIFTIVIKFHYMVPLVLRRCFILSRFDLILRAIRCVSGSQRSRKSEIQRKTWGSRLLMMRMVGSYHKDYGSLQSFKQTQLSANKEMGPLSCNLSRVEFCQQGWAWNWIFIQSLQRRNRTNW